ncbi:MAG: shikimate kinase [Paludibacteraceae bacterium]|nr:shikimate kinase [Paludibacteraceae bacterium]
MFPIYLIGYMGAGKTTVGRLLAQKLNCPFVDLDDAFAEITGMTTGEYIRKYGEHAFRRAEKDCVEKLSELPIQKVVYATGGGYPCWEDNMECLKELGTSFYLRWKNEHLARRIELSGIEHRPLLQGRSGSDLLAFVEWQMSGRASFYEQADYIVDADFDTLQEDNDNVLAMRIIEIMKHIN